MAVAGAVGTAGAIAISGGSASAAAPVSSKSHDTVVAHIKDPASGVVEVMVGDRAVSVRDADLVARILAVTGGK